MNWKEKISDIWDDIVFYTVEKPKKIYLDIRHWWKTCGKYKQHWKFVSYCCFYCYPWDNAYFLRTQYEWIKKSQAYFNDKCYCSDEKLNNEINRYQRKCLGLLEIMLDIREYWDYDYEEKKIIMKTSYNIKNKERFPYRGIDAEGNEHMSTDMYENNPEEYYKYKAKYLYYKILRDYSDSWWD